MCSMFLFSGGGITIGNFSYISSVFDKKSYFLYQFTTTIFYHQNRSAMKESTQKRSNLYATPSIETIDITCEQGFAISNPTQNSGTSDYNKETDDYD